MNKAIAFIQICFIFCLTLTIFGCGSTQSENVKTKGISAEMTVEGNSAGKLEVKAFLYAGSGGLGLTSLSLSGGDVLKATVNGVTQVLTQNTSFWGEVSYRTAFDHIDSGTETVVSLERKDDTSCPNSRVRLPDPLTVTTPSQSQRFNRSDMMTVRWSSPVNLSGSIDIQFLTTCTSPAGGSVVRSRGYSRADSGETTIAVADLFPDLAFDTTKECTSEMEITRTVVGTLDPGFGEGGSIKGIQRQTASFILKP